MSATTAFAVPAYDAVRSAYLSSEGVLLDRHGELLHEMRVDMSGRRLDWVTLDQMSPALLRAVVRAEDKRFYEHKGVDWLAITDAALESMWSSRARGASTLSMQVAAMLDLNLRPRKAHRTVGQKWEQMRAARELERHWSKRQILEGYLNLSTFRGEVQGIGAVARALFGKHPSGLDDKEGLILAVLLRGPNAPPAVVSSRACVLAKSMEPPLPCTGLEDMVQTRLAGAPNFAPAASLASHVAQALLRADARRVVSSLDARVQAFALDALKRQLAALGAQNVADGAVLVADNASGEVLAYVGNSGSGASARFVDGVRAPRQAGSTLKPFVYELAIEQRLLTAASVLDDSPVNLLTPTGLYVPQNYDRDFKGLVSARSALSASLNVPAVRTLMLVGTEPMVERLRALGFEFITQDGDYYGYSLALGSAEVSLWQLAQAYRTLGNKGVSSPLRLTLGAKPVRTPVLDRAASYIVTDVLADRASRSLTFGLDSPLSTHVWAAAKTGTSKDMRDNWCVGYTSRYTVAVWVGNFDGSAMWDVSGVSGAAPLWKELVGFLHRDLPSVAPAGPQDVERVQVSFEGVPEPARDELFISGTAFTRVVAKAPADARATIVYPASGQIVAVDPDIPEDAQLIHFRAEGAQPNAQWRLNGEEQPSSFWRPRPGRWTLSLHTIDGETLDSVQFEVRGGAH